MVTASTRWLAVRVDILCSVLISPVAFASVFLSQNPGKEICSFLSLQHFPGAFYPFITGNKKKTPSRSHFQGLLGGGGCIMFISQFRAVTL